MARHFIVVITSALLLLTATHAAGQTVITKNGKARTSIITADETAETHQAALLLQDFIKRISGAELAITAGKTGRIIIGGETVKGLGEDGFSIDTEGNNLYIRSGGGKGAIYGVVTLLEQHLGVSYWTASTCDYPHLKSITFPEIHIKETPAFRYRQSSSYCRSRTRGISLQLIDLLDRAARLVL